MFKLDKTIMTTSVDLDHLSNSYRLSGLIAWMAPTSFEKLFKTFFKFKNDI